MTKVIECPCGYVVRAATDDELVANAQQHAKETHDMEMTREQALAMAHPVSIPQVPTDEKDVRR